MRGDPKRGVHELQEFWESMAASEPWDQVVNHALLGVYAMHDLMVLPQVSPYQLPPWGEDYFRSILLRYFDFEELRELAKKPGAPALKIGAVEVVSGHFDIFRGEELCVECLLASAAIPEMFRAVTVPGRGVYWDGLFSQNPPIHDLVEHRIDELWVIQINSTTAARVPTKTHEIVDRRNALSGNLSMEQELGFMRSINRAIATGIISDPKYRPIRISRISLERELSYATKLDRRSQHIEELRNQGMSKTRWFLEERESNLRARAAE